MLEKAKEGFSSLDTVEGDSIRDFTFHSLENILSI